MNESLVEVGASSLVVEVPAGTAMSGYAARTSGSTGTHDPCTVRALAVGETCWVTVDVCALHEDTCSQIVDAAGLPTAHLAVSSTHTHAGPACTPGRLGGDDELVRAQIVSVAAAAVADARGSRGPATVFHSRAHGVGVAVDRRRAGEPIDPPVDLMRFGRPDGTVIAWLATYPCHPVVLSADNRLISGDYVSFLREELERVSPGSIALFLPGAAGDVNNGHAPEASFSSGAQRGRTFAEAERIGRRIAGVALDAEVRPVAVGPDHQGRGAVVAAERVVTLELRALDAEPPGILAHRWQDELTTADAGRAALLRSWIGWAHSRDADADPTSWEARVTVMRWGEVTVIGLPGEPFHSCRDAIETALHRALRARGGRTGRVLVTGYTNGCPGYLPDEAAYSLGGYEVLDAHRYYGLPAPFARGSIEQLQAAAVDLAVEP